MPFESIQRFPIRAGAALSFGGQDLTITGAGNLDLAFTPTDDPYLMTVRLRHVDLRIQAFEFPLEGEESLTVEGLSVDSSDFDSEISGGTLNSRTHEVSLRFAFSLDPEKIPALDQLGIRAPVRFEVTEHGRIDLEQGTLETRSEQFTVGHGPLRTLSISGDQFSHCETQARLCVAISEDAAERASDICQKEAWICPGQIVYLYWEVRVADHATIKGVGDLTLTSGGGGGVVRAQPTTDTDYKLTATGAGDNMCERTDTVTVRVVEPGHTRTLTAAPNPETGVWSVDIAKETTSPDIMLTSIKTISCGWGAGVYAVWNAMKTDLDGTVHYFTVTDTPTSPGRYPLVGSWKFVPVIPGQWVPSQNACFEVTQSCG